VCHTYSNPVADHNPNALTNHYGYSNSDPCPAVSDSDNANADKHTYSYSHTYRYTYGYGHSALRHEWHLYECIGNHYSRDRNWRDNWRTG
jgi:hypothetical protein